MRILFLLQYYKIGGVETVTHTLANKFVAEGHPCVIFSLHPDAGEHILPQLSSEVSFYEIDSTTVERKDVVRVLRECLVKHRIDVVINQSGHLYRNISFLKTAVSHLNIRIISVYHNMPGIDSLKGNDDETTVQQLKAKLSVLKSGLNMRRVYAASDIFVLLSDSFIERFKSFTKLSSISKLVSIANPLCLEKTDFQYRSQNKEKEILYVGRLENHQKQVGRILDVWSSLMQTYSDWSLIIVGDGPDREKLQKIANEKCLERIFFKGYENPIPFYKDASVLLLTSDYEGFPLVIVEAMSFGVVPVIFGSYPAVYDIVENSVNGFISKPNEGVFDINDFQPKLKQLINDKEKRDKMAQEAIRSIDKFSVDTIYAQWKKIIEAK